MFRNFLKAAFRNLRKNKSYSVLNITGLAIGIACAGLIFLWVENEVKWDSNNLNKNRLYALLINFSYAGSTFTNWSTPRPMAALIKKEIPGIANTCRVSSEQQRFLFTIGDKSVYASGSYADPSLFSMFTIPFIQGNAASAFEQLYSIVLTEKTVAKFFPTDAGKNVIGKTVRMNNKQDYVVTGVVKDLPQNSTLQFEWLVPYQVSIAGQEASGSNDAYAWDSYGPVTYVELQPSGNVSLINKLLYSYIHQKDATQDTHSFIYSMNDWHLYDEFVNGKQTGGGRIEQVRLLSIIAWIILLIACINFMNLTTARSATRAKEVGIRKVLGAERRSLVIQFIGEALSMSVMAAILSMGILKLTLPLFNQLIQKQLLLQFDNPVHITALLIITILCGLIAGSYPSFYLSSFNPVSVLKGLKIKTGSAAFIRQGLVVLQFTISIVFIISTIIIYLQIQHVKNRQLGFNKNNLIEINMQHDVSAMFPVVKQDLFATGVIENTTMAGHPIIYGGDSDEGFNWQGKSAESKVSVHFRKVSSEFVATTGMQIVQGKDFDANLPSANKVIINQTLANLIDKNNAVGKIIQSPRGQKEGEYKNYTVVGVVKDYMYGNMYGKANPTLLFCEPPDYNYLIYIRVKPQGDISKALSAIETVLKKDNPVYPFEYKFVDDQFNNMFINETLMSNLSGVFAVLAIIISCLGLFGLAAYTAERRLKEISIRKVLGANAFGIAGLLSKDFLQLVGIACLIAFPAAWWIMHNWLQDYEYRIQISWWIFFIAGLFAVVIALVTVSFQSIKAALVNPVKNLRSE